MQKQKRNDWFVTYQTIDGNIGQRDLNYRKDFFLKSDFENKTVLDIGCNMGQMCKYSLQLGASYVLGMDYDQSVIKLANSLLSNDESQKITYMTDDVDNYTFYTKLQKFDTILLLSVIETLELKNRFGMLSKLSSLCDVMYLEGHVNSVYSNLLKMILNYTTFTNIEFKGIQFDNKQFKEQNKKRHIFRCSNEKFNVEKAQKKILDLIEHKDKHVITIVGNGGVGKSHFKHDLINFLNKTSNKIKFDDNKIKYKNENNIIQSENKIILDNTETVCIIDDCVLQDSDLSNFNHIIYFDYRALKYLSSSVNTVFFINNNLQKRFENREEKYRYDRSPNINESLYDSIENIYHIDNNY